MILLPFCSSSFAENPHTLQLAIELAEDSLPVDAAVEFRRLALASDHRSEAAAYHWVAAYQYTQARSYAIAEAELNRMEAKNSEYSPHISLLRAELAEKNYDYDTASFFLDSIPLTQTPPPMTDYIERSKAVVRLKSGDVQSALLVTEREDVTDAILNYQASPIKKPRLGGLLGIIPGLGYAYSGEYANAVRSLILNSIFIYGMVDTAGDEEWGAFGVITFFEITWYTGSIYGGIDAANRFNEERLKEALMEIRGDTTYSPDYRQLPILKLKVEF